MYKLITNRLSGSKNELLEELLRTYPNINPDFLTQLVIMVDDISVNDFLYSEANKEDDSLFLYCKLIDFITSKNNQNS